MYYVHIITVPVRMSHTMTAPLSSPRASILLSAFTVDVTITDVLGSTLVNGGGALTVESRIG